MTSAAQVDADLASWVRVSLHAWLDPSRIEKLLRLLVDHDLTSLKLLRCTAEDELRKVPRRAHSLLVTYAFDAFCNCLPCRIGPGITPVPWLRRG